MKYALTATAVILAGFFLAARPRQHALHTLRAERQELEARATALGLAVDDPARATAPKRPASRTHGNPTADARAYADEVIRLFKDIKAGNLERGDEPPVTRLSRIVEQLCKLDAAQVGILLEVIRGSGEIDEEARRSIAGFAVITLAGSHPEAALDLFGRCQDMLQSADGKPNTDVLAKVLGVWSGHNPLAALAWAEANRETYGGSIAAEETQRAILDGAAAIDPQLALQLIRDGGLLELGPSTDPEKRNEAIARIAASARSPDAQAAMLAQLRALDDPAAAARAYPQLADRMAQAGFAETQRWLESAAPSPEECTQLATGIHYRATRGETGQWIDWMSGHLPASECQSRVGPLMSEWTTQDYPAASKWLAQAPAGPARDAATLTFAATVAPHDPAAAAQWADSLPDSPQRTPILHQILHHLRQKDPAAAASFAAKHGMD